MPTFKSRVIAVDNARCDFCRAQIVKGDAFVKVLVRDRYGRYTLRHHEHCNHTAELNRSAEDLW